MFVQREISLPEALKLECTAYSPYWKMIKGLDSYLVGVRMRSIGWRLIFVAGHLDVVEFGWHRQNAARRGVKRMLKKARELQFNCMELSGVVRKNFLGLPYMVISGDTYHIQKKMTLESTEQRSRPQGKAA